MMARLKNNTSKTNRIFFIFSPIVYDFKNVLVLMFLIEIKTVAFRYQCYCAIILCCNSKPHIQAYEMLEDITSIIACQEKKLCLSYAICRYSMELDDLHALFDCSFKPDNSHKRFYNFFETMILHNKDNFARSGMKT